jgi:hypothetical protein
LPTSGLRRSTSPGCSMLWVWPYGRPYRGGGGVRLGTIPPIRDASTGATHTSKKEPPPDPVWEGRLEMLLDFCATLAPSQHDAAVDLSKVRS